MLSGLRNVTRGWFAAILLGALALAMVVFLIPQDILNVGPADKVASGNGVAVTPAEYRRAYDRTLEEISRQNGGRSLTPDEARAQGVDVGVLQRLVTQKALERLADNMGFHAPDTMVAKQIREQQAFHSQLTKKFDRATYERLLGQNGMTPEQFEGELRSDLKRTQLALPFAVGGHAPKSFAKLIYTYETEQRTVNAAVVSSNVVAKAPNPTEADLQAFYKENQTRFATPEYRQVTLAIARPELFLAKIQVPEEKIRQTFDFRKGSLGGAETRSFVQISAASRETAAEAARRMAAGEEPKKVADALKVQLLPFDNVTRQQVLDPALADAVFSLKEGQTTGAVQGKLAWAAARVTKVTAVAGPTYESMRETLHAELAREEAETALHDAVQKFEDEVAGGKSMEDAARTSGLLVVPVARISAEGHDGGGAPIQGIADNQELLKAINATAVSERTEFTAIPESGGYVMARIDAIIPAGVRAFAEVRPMLTVGWQAQKTGEAIRKAADAFIADVKAGKSFADAARARKIPVALAGQTFSRQSIGQTPLAPLGAAIFAAREGEPLAGPDAGGQAIMLAQVTKIDRPTEAANPALFEQATRAAANMLDQDMLAAIQQGAVQDAKVKTNDKLRLQTIGVSDDQANDIP